MGENIFRFKKFEVSHGRSAMKVGVDAVLLGAVACSDDCPASILDIGTGCGVIALILAQRFADAKILAIDIDPESVDEARRNFCNSPWSPRLSAELESFGELIEKGSQAFDLIVSNPPFYRAGIKEPSTKREKARHQGSLSPLIVIEHSRELLTDKGRLALIFPKEFYDEAVMSARTHGLKLIKACFVKNNPRVEEKRVIVEFAKDSEELRELQTKHICLFEEGNPSTQYRNLCRDFYLYF